MTIMESENVPAWAWRLAAISAVLYPGLMLLAGVALDVHLDALDMVVYGALGAAIPPTGWALGAIFLEARASRTRRRSR